MRNREGGIIWNTQGSGKSLIMVWLAKWIREHVADPRMLIVTDRTELDEQIERVFRGVNEDIYRTESGADLIARLNAARPWLVCSLIHKFGSRQGTAEEADTEAFIQQMQRALPPGFRPKGNLFVFVDECHRTQSGKLRHLIDTYIRADESEKVSAFDDLSLIQLIVERGTEAVQSFPEGIRKNPEAVAEAIENNVRKLIIDEQPINPKYYASGRTSRTCTSGCIRPTDGCGSPPPAG